MSLLKPFPSFRKHFFLALGVCITLAACTSAPPPPSYNLALEEEASESAKLAKLTKAYFNEQLLLSPLQATNIGVHKLNDKFNQPLSPEFFAYTQAVEQKYLNELSKIDVDKLAGQDLLSYQIFKRDRKLSIDSYQFPDYMLPINQMYGMHNFYAGLGSGESAQPFDSFQDYQNFISRSQGYAIYMDSVIWAMRQGIKEGVVLPRALVDKLIPQFKVHMVDQPEDSIFYGPVRKLENNKMLTFSEKQKVTEQYRALITEVLVPSYKKVHDFLVNEYRPNARESYGLSSLPNGKAWYQYKIKTHTTLDLSAEEIHEFGKQEVARILNEMKKVKQTVGFDGDLTAFFDFLQNDPQFYFTSEQELIDAYVEVKDKINARVPLLFDIAPKADYQVKAVEAYRAASSAGASYQAPAPDGSRPGIFYINSYNLKAQPKFLVETLSIHEAAPGHHFQISLQQEVKGLPLFRKFSGYTVFAEGWALYAESLGKDLGLFTDPYQWYGRLVDEQLRAMRLVVDTGLHAFGWSRQQAIHYMAANSSMALSDIEAEVERYIAIPGQALSYKVGQRAITQMREDAKAVLGDNFDIRAFHTQILIDGALPMPILKAKIARWVETQKAS